MMKERKKEWREEEVVNLGPGIAEGWWVLGGGQEEDQSNVIR